MDVRELNRDQLEELKQNWFWDACNNAGCVSEGQEDHLLFPEDPRDYGYPHNIPDELVMAHFAGIDFVQDDFCCSPE